MQTFACRLITDEHMGYQRVGTAYKGGHETVNHSIGEYARAGSDAHSNTIEA